MMPSISFKATSILASLLVVSLAVVTIVGLKSCPHLVQKSNGSAVLTDLAPMRIVRELSITHDLLKQEQIGARPSTVIIDLRALQEEVEVGPQLPIQRLSYHFKSGSHQTLNPIEVGPSQYFMAWPRCNFKECRLEMAQFSYDTAAEKITVKQRGSAEFPSWAKIWRIEPVSLDSIRSIKNIQAPPAQAALYFSYSERPLRGSGGRIAKALLLVSMETLKVLWGHLLTLEGETTTNNQCAWNIQMKSFDSKPSQISLQKQCTNQNEAPPKLNFVWNSQAREYQQGEVQ